MKLIVTGSNGLLGARLTRQLHAAGHSVLGVGRGPARAHGAGEYVECDLARPNALVAIARQHRTDAIVHCASMTDVDGCARQPESAFAVNVGGTAQCAEAANATGAHLVYVSTDYVFDGTRGNYGEADVPNPAGAYGLTKYAAELTVRTLARSWAIARTAVVFGWPSAARPNFGSWLAQALRSGTEVNLFADQIVSPTLADDLAAMLAELAEGRIEGVWHCAGADRVNRVEFGTLLARELGVTEPRIRPVSLQDAKLASPRPRDSGLDVSKAQQLLRFKPRPLSQSIADFAAQVLGS